MENKAILIIGASGLIGRHIFNIFEGKKIGTYCNSSAPELIYFDLTKSSINELPLDEIGYAIICSAITKLEECKKNPDYSYEVNVKSLKRIISELAERGIVPIFLSSAAVFDGVEGGYKEDDERNPISLYGKHKLDVEDFIFSHIKEYIIIRPGKVFGINKGEGVLFTEWISKYKNNETICCADDEKLAVTYVEDLAKAILLLIKENVRGIWHINPPEYYSRYDLALKFFNYLNIADAKIVKCSIDDFGFLEKRAKNTFLDASKFLDKTDFSFTSLANCFNLIKQNLESL